MILDTYHSLKKAYILHAQIQIISLYFTILLFDCIFDQINADLVNKILKIPKKGKLIIPKVIWKTYMKKIYVIFFIYVFHITFGMIN